MKDHNVLGLLHANTYNESSFYSAETGVLAPNTILRLIFVAILAANQAAASPFNIPPHERPQVRTRMLQCETWLTSSDQVDDSVGIPFGASSPEQFEQELNKAIETHGLEKFRNGTFYVTGIAMQSEQETKLQYDAILNRLNLPTVNAKAVIMSSPSRLIEQESVSVAQHAIERARYFFPSLKMDLQKPQWGEVITNWQATLAIESVNVYFVFDSMPFEQASLVVATHAILINAYTIFNKSILNYLMREGSRDEKINHVELFFKQMLLSAPFVINYSVFGHLSDILNFYAAHGWQQTVAAFPYELSHFATTQGLTLAIQTIFYSQIVTKGFGGWVDGQTGDQNTRDARTLRPILQIPVLAADSVLLMLAAGDTWKPFLSLGPFDFNAGHAGILAMTAASWLFFKKFPKAFDHVLRHYQRLKNRKFSTKPSDH